jgi:hypothetical protein
LEITRRGVKVTRQAGELARDQVRVRQLRHHLAELLVREPCLRDDALAALEIERVF